MSRRLSIEINFKPVWFSVFNSLQNLSGLLQSLVLGVEDGLVDPFVGEPHQGLDVFGSLGKFVIIDQGEMRVSGQPGVDLKEVD